MSTDRNAYFKRHYPSLWLAINHHRTHNNKRITFNRYEYLRAIFLDRSPFIALMKSTQNGITEWATMTALAKALERRSIFYVLPTGHLKDRYVKNRLDRSIQFTEFYQDVSFNERKKRAYGRFSESMSLKHFGGGTIAFVGSNSPSSFTEFPADDVVIDELDQCDQRNILMADERLSNSDDPRRIYISNPTVDGYGIDTYFADTDQKHWLLRCEHCGHWFELDWFETVVREVDQGRYEVRDDDWSPEGDLDCRPVCPKCAKPVDRYARGEWVRKYPSVKKSGYHIAKTFSSKTTIAQLIDNFLKGLANEERMERFYNADLGLPYTGKGSKITQADIIDCVAEYGNQAKHPERPCVMGIDVGRKLHVTIGYLNEAQGIDVTAFLEVAVEVEEVLRLIREYGVNVTVIDAQPEGHFVNKLKSVAMVFACRYADLDRKTEPVDRYRNVTVGRTESLDSTKEAVVTKMVKFPLDVLTIPGVVAQLTAATRIFDPGRNKGRGAYRWTEGTKDDHYHHALNYLLIARRILVMAGR